MKNVTDLISKAFEKDEKIQQNLVLRVEKLVIDGHIEAATIFANCAFVQFQSRTKTKRCILGYHYQGSHLMIKRISYANRIMSKNGLF